MTTISLRSVIPTVATRSRVRGRTLAVAVVVLALLGTGVAVLLGHGSGKRTVTAYFSQAISIYPGTDVDIMGVPVGKVTGIHPEGSRVKVTMQYDRRYRLPANVKAAIITPTLIADRFVQLAPAYTSGATLHDHASIPMARTAVPVEMDDIYKNLDQLSTALGPQGANKKGALGRLLHTSAGALQGNGALGNKLISNLSQAMQTLGDNSGALFDTLDGLASVSETLNQNDATVQRFLTRFNGVSTELSGESGDLSRALNAIANAVVITKSFVHDNKTQLVGDVKDLNTTLSVLAKDQKTLGTVLQLAPLGLGDLALAWDPSTGTEGIRLQVGPTGSDLPNILCDLVTNDKISDAAELCTLFKALIPSQLTSDVGAGLPRTTTPLPGATTPSVTTPSATPTSTTPGITTPGITPPSMPTGALGGSPTATGLGSLVDQVQSLAGGGQ